MWRYVIVVIVTNLYIRFLKGNVGDNDNEITKFEHEISQQQPEGPGGGTKASILFRIILTVSVF